jgi:catechol 2,3-dioxygenase
LLKLQQNRIKIIGASDHGVSEAIYIEDPDKNGLELYWDKPKEEWPYDEDSNLKMFSKPLNIKNLLSELNC